MLYCRLAGVLTFISLISIAKSCYIVELSNAGFAANSNGLFPAFALYGHGANGTLYVDQKDFKYGCSHENRGSWEDFFDLPAGLYEPLTPENAAHAAGCVKLELYEAKEHFYSMNMGDFIALEEGARIAWKPKADTAQHVSDQLASMNAAHHPTIAFHIRGGDKAPEDEILKRKPVGPTQVVDAAVHAWPHVMAHPVTCILVGDDRHAQLEAEARLKEKVQCASIHRTGGSRNNGHQQGEFNAMELSHRCKASKLVVSDIDILSRADYAVISWTSGFAALTEAIRSGAYKKLHSTFADASDHHLDQWANARRILRGDPPLNPAAVSH